MNGTEFLRRARRYARRNSQQFRFDQAGGKGSHGKLCIGAGRTVVKHGEISKGMLRSMRRHRTQGLLATSEPPSMDYAYPCILTPDEDEKGSCSVVNFPDVPEAITGARTREESLLLAEDALVVALSMYVDVGEDIPAPSAPAAGQDLITVPPHTAAQLALYTAMRREGKSAPRLTRTRCASRGGADSPG